MNYTKMLIEPDKQTACALTDPLIALLKKGNVPEKWRCMMSLMFDGDVKSDAANDQTARRTHGAFGAASAGRSNGEPRTSQPSTKLPRKLR